ncbi:MAG: hypothetical protein ACKVJK_02390 [Methylophagaceae bacterium]|jgi:hypothetical protein|tara:strand:- start:593 stop:877 length:285 start_codon:yes stop_codon:yes gene_type:complete
MSLLKSKLTMIPGEALIYERADGVVYARYRDKPHNKIPRWIVGGDPAGVARAQGELLNYSEWQELCELSLEYPTLKKLLDQLVTTYYTVKDHRK